MLVITRNGKTNVYTGWRAWLLLALAFVIAWGLLTITAAVFVGVALSVGLLMLLLIPAAIIVALISGIVGQRS
jgi:hypothetical protein